MNETNSKHAQLAEQVAKLASQHGIPIVLIMVREDGPIMATNIIENPELIPDVLIDVLGALSLGKVKVEQRQLNLDPTFPTSPN